MILSLRLIFAASFSLLIVCSTSRQTVVVEDFTRVTLLKSYYSDYPRFQHPRLEPIRLESASAEEANRAPNPFAPAASWFAFDVVDSAMVTILITDTIGTVLDTIIHQPMAAGVYEIRDYVPPTRFSGVLFWMAVVNGELSAKKRFLVLN